MQNTKRLEMELAPLRDALTKALAIASEMQRKGSTSAAYEASNCVSSLATMLSDIDQRLIMADLE